MTRRPTSRGVSLVATTALLALMLLVPAGASAAVPTVIVDGTGPNPVVVSAGEPVAFSTALTNDDTSNISLKLTTTDQSLVVLSAKATNGTCAVTTPLSCTFKNIKPGMTAKASIVLRAPSSGASFNAQLKWDTTGVAKDRGGNSHGDSFYYPHGVLPTAGLPLTVGLNTDATNFRARYVLTPTQQTVANAQAVNSANPHATKVIAPSTLMGVTVQDGTGVTALACAGCFGETSIIEVAGGDEFPGGFRVVITMDSSEIPGGVNAGNVAIYHEWDGGSENISLRCTFTAGLPDTMPCLNAKKLPGNDLEITIWTTHNGIMRGNA